MFKSNRGGTNLKAIIAVIAILLVPIIVFFLTTSSIVGTVFDWFQKAGTSLKDKVEEGADWFKDLLRDKFGVIDTTMDLYLINDVQVQTLKNNLDSIGIATDKVGLTEVRLRKMLLAYTVSNSLSDTLCAVPVTEEQIVANVNEKEYGKNLKTITDFTNYCLNNNKYKYSNSVWTISSPSYTLYYDSDKFFYFKDTKGLISDNTEQWYLGAMGATTITPEEGNLRPVTQGEFNSILAAFEAKSNTESDIKKLLESTECKNLLGVYYKKSADTIVVATINTTQKAYSYKFKNDNIEDIIKEADLTDYLSGTKSNEFYDDTINCSAQKSEIVLSDVIDTSSYVIPIELMINFLDITGSGEFVEEFIDYALNQISATAKAYPTTSLAYTYSKKEYNIKDDFIMEVYDMYDIANEDSGNDNFKAYKDIIFNRKYNGTAFEHTVSELEGFLDIDYNDLEYAEGKTYSVSPLHTYLQTAYNPAPDFTLGKTSVTEGEVLIASETKLGFSPSKISTWYGDITYTDPQVMEIFISPSSAGEISEADFNNFGYDNLVEAETKSDETIEKKYIYEGNAKQGGITAGTEGVFISPNNNSIYGSALATKPGIENKSHFSNWNINGLIEITAKDGGEKHSSTPSSNDYIYSKYTKTNQKVYTSFTKSKNQILNTSNVSKSSDNIDEKLNQFLELLKNSTGKIPTSINSEGGFKQDGKVVEYGDIYNGTIKVGDLLLDNGALILFELLESSENTQSLVIIFKYLAFLYTGTDYGVTLDDLTSIFSLNIMTGIYGSSIQEKVWYTLKGCGYSDIAVAGAMGNISVESSGFSPSAVEAGSGEGIGLCQWSYGRKQELIDYATSKGTDWTDVDTQIEFLVTEITGDGPAKGYATQQWSNQRLNEWANASTVEEATEIFCTYFERPGIPHLDRRKSEAKVYYQAFQGKNIPETGNYNGTFLQIAEQCHEYLRINNYHYDHGAKIPLNAKNGTYADCSSYVSWVLYEYGYSDFGGNQHVCADFINNKNSYQSKYGWKYKKATEAVPGDIIVRSDHMEIYAGDGRYLNAGSTEAMRRPLSGAKWGTAYLSNFTYSITISAK